MQAGISSLQSVDMDPEEGLDHLRTSVTVLSEQVEDIDHLGSHFFSLDIEIHASAVILSYHQLMPASTGAICGHRPARTWFPTVVFPLSETPSFREVLFSALCAMFPFMLGEPCGLMAIVEKLAWTVLSGICGHQIHSRLGSRPSSREVASCGSLSSLGVKA